MDPQTVDELYRIIEADDFEQLNSYISSGLDINGSFPYLPENEICFGQLPVPFINLAASINSLQCVIALLVSGTDVELVDGEGNNAFIAAAYGNTSEVAHELLTAGMDPMCTNSQGFNALHIAAQYGNNDFIKMIMQDFSFKINEKTSSYNTPLMLAAINGHEETVDLLLSMGGSLSVTDSEGNTPVHIAIQNGSIKCAQRMLASGQFPCNIVNSFQRTILHEAAITGNVELFILILQRGENPRAVDCDRNTVLHLAAVSMNFFLIDFILANRIADPNALNRFGFAAIHYSAAYGPIESFRAILSVSSSVLNNNTSGYAPIHLAVKHDHFDIVQMIFAHKSFDPRVYDKGYMTPLHIAARGRNAEMIEFLIKTSFFEISAVDSAGWMPIHYAASKGSLECIKVLIKYGADPTMLTEEGENVFDILQRRGSRNIYQYIESL